LGGLNIEIKRLAATFIGKLRRLEKLTSIFGVYGDGLKLAGVGMEVKRDFN